MRPFTHGVKMTKTITATLAVMAVAPQKIMTKRKKNPLALNPAAVAKNQRMKWEAEEAVVALRLQLPAVPVAAVVPPALAVVAAAQKNQVALRRSLAAPRRRVPVAPRKKAA